MASRALNLMVGASLKIEPTDGNVCYLVELVGYVTDKSLIVTPAYDDGSHMNLKIGDELSVRYLGRDKSYAFYSKIIQVNKSPYLHFHLQYPEGVQGLSARRVTRTPIEGPILQLNISDGASTISVVMADISTSGARLISETRLGGDGERFIIEMPNINASQSGHLSLPCTIRHVQEQYPDNLGQVTYFHHGVEFDQLEEAAQLFIARFIQDSISRTAVR